MSFLLQVLALVGVALCRPADDDVVEFSTKPLSPEDREFLSRHSPTHRLTYPAGFQFMYVNQQGQIVENHKPATGHYVEITGSPDTSKAALYVAAQEVGKMMKNSPERIFNNIADHANSGVGLFTAAEKLTVYPQFAHLKDTPECQGRCDGSCAHTCTFDGRKWETLGGIGGVKAVILIDNVMCTAHDPHHHRDNILVHEFAHIVHHLGTNATEKNLITSAYNNAKSAGLWVSHSYVMATAAEYFAVGTGVFFFVEMQRATSGGMILCGIQQCVSEQAVRQHIHDHDPQLFSVLADVYTSGHPETTSGMKICESTTGR